MSFPVSAARVANASCSDRSSAPRSPELRRTGKDPPTRRLICAGLGSSGSVPAGPPVSCGLRRATGRRTYRFIGRAQRRRWSRSIGGWSGGGWRLRRKRRLGAGGFGVGGVGLGAVGARGGTPTGPVPAVGPLVPGGPPTLVGPPPAGPPAPGPPLAGRHQHRLGTGGGGVPVGSGTPVGGQPTPGGPPRLTPGRRPTRGPIRMQPARITVTRHGASMATLRPSR